MPCGAAVLLLALLELRHASGDLPQLPIGGSLVPRCCKCHGCDGCSLPPSGAFARRLQSLSRPNWVFAKDCCHACGVHSRVAPVAAPRAAAAREVSRGAHEALVGQPAPALAVPVPWLPAPHRHLELAGIVPREPERIGSFAAFEPIRQVGIFCWDPTGLQEKDFRDVTTVDILQGLHQQETQPDRLVPLNSVHPPMLFPNLPPQPASNRFPFEPGYFVPLYVAKARGVDLQSVDFILGGSALHMLANKDMADEHKYLIQRCPTTNIIALSKSNIYSTNYADFGFVFERLMTGRALDDKRDPRHFESLQLIKVAGYTVLFSSEIDAVDGSGVPVELRSCYKPASKRSPHCPKVIHKKLKTLFQMLSSGSKTLVVGDRRGPSLEAVRTLSFDDVVALPPAGRLIEAERNIAEGLRMLKRRSSEISAAVPSELEFHQGLMILTPYPSGDLLPAVSVVEELLRATPGDNHTVRLQLQPQPHLQPRFLPQTQEGFREIAERLSLEGEAEAVVADEAGRAALTVEESVADTARVAAPRLAPGSRVELSAQTSSSLVSVTAAAAILVGSSGLAGTFAVLARRGRRRGVGNERLLPT